MISVHRRALERAILLSGGEEALAKHLHVDPAALRFWRLGDAPIPGDAFLKIVDLLVERSMAELRPRAPAGKPKRPLS